MNHEERAIKPVVQDYFPQKRILFYSDCNLFYNTLLKKNPSRFATGRDH
jgi:hypothetical protein